MGKYYNGDKIKSRDNYTCVYCGSRDELTIDHVIPLSRFREYHLHFREVNCDSNLVTACQSCNYSKRDSSPEDFFKEDPKRKRMFLSRAKFVNDRIRSLVNKM